MFLSEPDLNLFSPFMPASNGSNNPNGGAALFINIGAVWQLWQEGAGPPPGGGVLNNVSPAASAGVKTSKPCFTRSYFA